MRIHFIAIGGSAMHNLALALYKKGYKVTGSDDEIFEPAQSRLETCGLLPAAEGWFPSRITMELDAVILGMHAKDDNPELVKAKKLGLKIYSYPEFLYEQSRYKKRIVIGGSHGKTTITAMILHVLKDAGIDTDYMVGAQLEGFDVMVRLTEEAPFMVMEGDEYLTSSLDKRPKFHVYKPDIALISGIAWDHINVFPTFGNYVEQFREFIRLIMPGGMLIWCAEDEVLMEICQDSRKDISILSYSYPVYTVKNGITVITENSEEYPLQIFGKHNLLNLNGARMILNAIGITDERFYRSIMSFKGASKRLEMIHSSPGFMVFRDFAHAPSKVKATIEALKEQYPRQSLVACLELHTYSSLSKEFMGHYAGSMDTADQAIVYYSPHAIQLKKLAGITEKQVKEGFRKQDLEIFTEPDKLQNWLLSQNWNEKILLMMSSGDFDGMNIAELAGKIHNS